MKLFEIIKKRSSNGQTKAAVAEKRNIGIRKFDKNVYNDIVDYLEENTYKTGINTIWFNGVPLDFIFQFNAIKKPLFVFFHGAVDQSKTIIPHFVGLSYKRLIEANLLHIADSSLIHERSLRTGWYLGCSRIQLLEVIKNIVQHLSKFFETERIIFFGSSGGGFPSLCLSQMIPGSLSIVNSPATTVKKHPHRATRVSQYLKVAFSAQNDEEEDHILNTLLKSDLQEGFNHNVGNVIYLLNKNDHGNIKFHSLPFFKQFSEKICLTENSVQRIGSIFLVTGDWGRGHRYPPPRILNRLFSKVTDRKVEWSDVLTENTLKELL